MKAEKTSIQSVPRDAFIKPCLKKKRDEAPFGTAILLQAKTKTCNSFDFLFGRV
jgi:hypothetical protein